MASKKSVKRPETARSPRTKTAVKLDQTENNQLKVTIAYLQNEVTSLKQKLNTVTEKLVSNVDKSDYNIGSVSSYLDIPTEDLIYMISDISSKKEKQGEHYLESRIEEVETRITQISTEFAKLFQLKLQLENGLEDIESCYFIDDVHKLARSLKHNSVNTPIYIQAKTGAIDSNNVKFEEIDSALIINALVIDDNKRSWESSLPVSLTCNLENIDVPTITKKLAGDKHVKNMIPELKKLVIQTLSLQKGNGSDWRMFAKRIGLSETLIDQWRSMKLNQPMRNVLNVWSDSPGATVRLLHRHLISPEIKSILLAKRISDYYNVD